MGNKVNFSIKNVHYAILEETAGVYSWKTPIALPGAVSLSLEAEGEITPFYADGKVYFRAVANNGYSGDLELANFGPQFLKDVYGYKEGETSKLLTENANVQPKPFALLFEEDGDEEETKFVLYSCEATRPSRTFETATDTKEVSTQTIAITAAPLGSNGDVMTMTQPETPADVKAGWYNQVTLDEAA